MTHEESALLIPDLEKGRLGPEEEAAVRAHMAHCTECAGLSDAYQTLTAGICIEAEHPDSSELVAHAMGTSLRPEVEAHLGSCAACAQQAAAIRSAESELATSRVPMRGWSTWAAAAAACLLLGYVGWIQLFVMPGMREALPETMSLPLLAPMTRGGDEPVGVPVRQGQRSITVAIAPALPGDLVDSEPLTIEVRNRSGAIVFSSETTAGEMRRLTGKSGAFALVLPAPALSIGDASLSIRSASRGELLATPFRVHRE